MQSISNSLSPLLSTLNFSQPINCRLFFSTPNLIYWILYHASDPKGIIKSGICDIDPQNGVSRREVHFESIPFSLNNHQYKIALHDTYPVPSFAFFDF